MNTNTILFSNLPFRPEPNQVFFIENGYDEDVNDLIRDVYLRLKAKFARVGMDFYYMPYLLSEHDIEAKLRYYAPYLSSSLWSARSGAMLSLPISLTKTSASV